MYDVKIIRLDWTVGRASERCQDDIDSSDDDACDAVHVDRDSSGDATLGSLWCPWSLPIVLLRKECQ